MSDSNQISKPEASGLLGLIHSARGGAGLPTPFEREIHLFDSIVAGTTHIEGIHDIEPSLAIHDRLTFRREPENPYDPQAIRIQTEDGTKIGYVPRQDNVIFARLMDAGKLLFGRITEKELRGSWLRISIGIYLQD
ncbi:MAG: HIRAN domain-containing protein [Bacillota bacterium]|nr:HIRAN domain-containing protein [Bacillota bacterium]